MIETSPIAVEPTQKKARMSASDDAIGKGLELLAESQLKVQRLKAENKKEELQRAEPQYKIAIKDFLSIFKLEYTTSERLLVAEYFAGHDILAGMYNLLDYDMKKEFIHKILFN